MAQPGICPNCNSQLNERNITSSEDKIKAINFFTSNPSMGFCSRCYAPLASQALIIQQSWIGKLKQQIQIDLQFFPVVTLQSPQNWEYSLVKLVSAQSVTIGTSFNDIFNSNIDIFGVESPLLEYRLKKGEDICMNRLKIDALNSGANAIIGTKIDYLEVKAFANTIMVCISGTAINMLNTDMMPEAFKTGLTRLKTNMHTLNECYKYRLAIVK